MCGWGFACFEEALTATIPLPIEEGPHTSPPKMEVFPKDPHEGGKLPFVDGARMWTQQ